MSIVQIQPAQTHNLPHIMQLWREFSLFLMHQDASRDPSGETVFASIEIAEPEYTAFVKANLQSPEWGVMLATCDDKPVGYAMCHIQTYPVYFQSLQYGFIEDLIVTERHRGTGVGKALFQAITAWLREREITRIELSVMRHNHEALSFWQHMGFNRLYTVLQRQIDN
jgi:GNAT superfamily N-acetyltransferase